jgi:hypothetical protein
MVTRHQQVHQGLEDFISLQGVKTRACLDFMFGLEVSVRYHCGGRPVEVNASVLNSYMVYL